MFELYHLSEYGWQTEDRTPEQIFPFSAFAICLRRFRLICNLQGSPIFRIIGRHQHWQFRGASFPQDLERGIDSDSGKPRREGRPAFKSLEVNECSQEGVLKRILRIFAIPCDSLNHYQNFPGMPLAKLCKCRAIPGTCCRKKQFIIHLLYTLADPDMVLR